MAQQTANMATGQHAQSYPLVRVPAEILDRITWHLTTPELCNLRLTCKSVEEALYFRFTADFFTRKQFMVSEFSLGALIDISKSRLSACLRHVHFGLDQLGTGNRPAISNSMEQARMFQQLLVQQESLWSLGLVTKHMAQAFASLPNLESVVVRDFNSNRRSRDGPYAHWLSYGSNTVHKETSVWPFGGSPMERGYSSRLFKAIVHALGMAGASPKTIEVMERRGNPLYDTAFYIHPEFEAVIPVLRGLKRLHLSLEGLLTFPPAGYNEPYHWFNLTNFLRHCDGLEELRINGKHDSGNNSNHSGLNHLYDWLAAAESTSETEAQKETMPPSAHEATRDISLPTFPAKFPFLKNISLGMTAIKVNELARFIAKFADTLRYLELWRIQLVSDKQGLDKSQVFEDRDILFVQLLEKLLNVPNLNLRHIKLGNLQQKWSFNNWEQLNQDVNFKATAKTADEDIDAGTEPVSQMLEYTGTDWRHFVTHEMIPRLYTSWIRDDDEDEDEEHDGNDNAGGMDQDDDLL